MKIAVTGSDGFIGRPIVKKLRAKGHGVIECRRKNCDVLRPEQVIQALKGADVVVHCAAKLDENASDLIDVNVAGTENVLEACAANGAKHLIFLSTVGVYGLLGGMKDENTEPRPETPYERSKLEAEKKVLSYQEVFHVTILRPAIVLGKNKYWQKIVRLVAKGFPIIGDGKNRWQMVCVEDVVGAIAFCIGREECYGEIFIVAEQEAVTLEETVNEIRASLGMEGTAMKIPVWLGNLIAALNGALHFNSLLTPPYIKRLQADRAYSTKKLEALGWKAKLSAKGGIPGIAKWAMQGK